MEQAGLRVSDEELLKRISSINRAKGAVVQGFDYGSVVDRMHLVGAYLNALSAFKNHTNKTESLPMEMLLFAAMTDQITAAIDRVGIKKGKLVIFASRKGDFDKIRPLLKDVRDFRPTRQHMTEAARKFGITNTDNADMLLLQKMAVSRLKL